MFSFRHDKTGFFSGLILMTVVGGTVLATILLLIFGGWENYSLPMKCIWGAAWVACIVTVLVRISIFRSQMRRAEQQQGQERDGAESPRPGSPDAPVGGGRSQESTRE
jgi:hypothetical protein